MPLVRYDLRSEFSIANPEVYKSVPKSDAEALFEGITMAALAGSVRQLGELSELAAEIFNDLHEEAVSLCSRGRKLAARVKQLESELPAFEQSVFTETDQLRFAFSHGLEWHPTISENENHNHFGQELPHFIQKSYDESRGPPRFDLLDCFDVAGPGASLKRYTDPSFFRTEWVNSELIKAEKAQAGRRARNAKKDRKRVNCSEDITSEANVSFLKASKFIRSVDSFMDPYKKDTSILSVSLRSLKVDTLRISAKDIEAGSLLRNPSNRSPSDSDHSPDQFVDALATMEAEPEQENSTLVSHIADENMKMEPESKSLETSRPPSSGSNQLDQLHAVEGYYDGIKPTVVEETRNCPGATKLSFYTSTSPSEISSPNSELSFLSDLSDESHSQHIFSVLDSPLSMDCPSKGFSTMLLSPGSPTMYSTEINEQINPPPPPLPPTKWRITRSPATPPKTPKEEVTISSDRDLLLVSIVSHDKDKLRKVEGHIRTKSKSFDSREVLLEQIRSKSFSLKHAVLEPKSESPQAASGNVSAVLEKASAIRKALGDSDDDEDFS